LVYDLLKNQNKGYFCSPKPKLLNVFYSLQDFNPKSKTIVTIGTFDGVHIGHRIIIDKIVQNCKKGDLESTILTFFPHPRMVLQNNSEIKLLNTIDEKIKLLENTGLQNLIIHKFDKSFSELSAEEFVLEVLVKQLNIQKIIIGHDHRFGKNRSANIDDLIVFGKKYNFEVEQISAEELNDVAVSSTKIRNAISDGNVTLANRYLGYQYFLSGIIIKGKQLGRTIGFPTANLKIDQEYKQIPKNGVYIVRGLINNQFFNGIMNIGFRPTVDGETISIETHFLDFDFDIYDQTITIEIFEHIRKEQKFESLEILKSQIEKDKQVALDYFLSLQKK
jgi:riboflavin kinase / FMN adenylyltransferase